MANVADPRMAQRVIRVFVSSTFRDMQAEREELVKRVFPRLRKRCEGRGVTWGEVDLRWGITDEQKAEGKVLPVCLDEIERCRPYFIGLLGERYGWVPDEVSPDLIAREPWIVQHAGRSVTELEILHGVLNNPDMGGHAFFYLRDPRYVESVPSERRVDFVEVAAEQIEKLQALKRRIRASGFPVREAYDGPKTLGDLVFEDLSRVIDERFPEGSEPDPLDRVASDHEAFAVSRFRVYIGRPEYVARLNAHAAGDGPPLVVLGDSGSGKSALLANWALQYRELHPTEFLVMHFIGATPESADWTGMVRRIIGEISRRFDVTIDTPNDPTALRAAFATALGMAAGRGRLVMLLDALNQLEDRDQALELSWLPQEIPSRVRLITSTLPGRAFDELVARGWPTVTVQPLEVPERRLLISEYLAQYTKALTDRQVDRIATAPPSANPLYLRVLLEELRLFGVQEQLESRIEHYLEAASIDDLYERVLARYEADYEENQPGLVRDAFSCIWAARRGLAEAELLDLLGTEDQPLPHALWSALSLAAESSLVSRSGRVSFFHDYLRTAVREKYLATERQRKAAHSRLADYFERRDLTSRKIGELPWQLAEAGLWERLARCLGEPLFFTAAWEQNEFDVKQYWARVEANSSFSLVDVYRPIIDDPGRAPASVSRVSTLLRDTGHLAETAVLRDYLLQHSRESGNSDLLAGALLNKAISLYEDNRFDEALALAAEARALADKLGSKWRLRECLHLQAVIHSVRGDLDRSQALFEEHDVVARETGADVSLLHSLGNRGLILQDRGELDAALALHQEEERMARRLGRPDDLAAAFSRQANVFRTRGDLDRALALYKEAESIGRSLGIKERIRSSLQMQAVVLRKRDAAEALKLYREEEKLCRELGDRSRIRACLFDQADLVAAQGDRKMAESLRDEAERFARECGDRKVLAAALAARARLVDESGDQDRALVIFQEEETIRRELRDKQGLQVCLGNQAALMARRKEYDEALGLHREKEQICRELGQTKSLLYCVGIQAKILNLQKKADLALAKFEEQERLARQLDDNTSLRTACAHLGLLRAAQGDPDGAMRAHTEDERLSRLLGDKRALIRCLYNQTHVLLYARKDPAAALATCEEAIRVGAESNESEHLPGLIKMLSQIREQLGG